VNLDQAEKLVAQLLAPLPLNRFLDEILGKTFVFVGDTAGRDWRAALLGGDPEGAILVDYARLGPHLGSHSAAPTGPIPGLEALGDATAFKAKIDAFQARGYTVRLPAMRAITPALDTVVRALEAVFHVPVGAEIFWSRGDARAPAHHDDFDLIVAQIKGTKRWYISTDRSELPNVWRGIPEGEETIERFAVVDIAPGNLLYLPRGTKHRVDATSDAIHVSIGFTPVTLREALIACIDRLSDIERPLRESIGERMARQSESGNFGNLPSHVRGGVAALAHYCAMEGFIADALQQRASQAIGKLDKLRPSVASARLTLASRLRQNPLCIHHLSGNQAKIDFAYPGGHHYLHRGGEEAISFVARTQSFRVRDIPGAIGDEVRLALAERFLASGILEPDGE
jgi:bifunctional lysine-specific demethylase and histidyl-hydroxylase MINA